MTIERSLNEEEMKERIIDSMDLEEILQFLKILEIRHNHNRGTTIEKKININDKIYSIIVEDAIHWNTSRILIYSENKRLEIHFSDTKSVRIYYTLLKPTIKDRNKGICDELCFEIDLELLPTNMTVEDLRKSYFEKIAYIQRKYRCYYADKIELSTTEAYSELNWSLIPSSLKYNEGEIIYGRRNDDLKYMEYRLTSKDLQLLTVNGESVREDVSYDAVAEIEKLKKLVQENKYGFDPETISLFNNILVHSIEEVGKRQKQKKESFIQASTYVPAEVKNLQSIAEKSLIIINSRFTKEELKLLINMILEMFKENNMDIEEELNEAEKHRKRVRSIIDENDPKTIIQAANQLKEQGY